ncbi:hypothetical protein EGR_08928 [Echinococcus granulosus]|uniref:Uncharacterized protein n=1 Tax=Echinococcus granulosus TaxID=6210 RepID=W6U776_ECHGR|nr:hypothetical protein EGR_08928 [Echinococcus granulosus]EUB56226.1 hypothetical protein EGR_08928 [Echinococcus granulosus]
MPGEKTPEEEAEVEEETGEASCCRGDEADSPQLAAGADWRKVRPRVISESACAKAQKGPRGQYPEFRTSLHLVDL